jgi:hypothetical protein
MEADGAGERHVIFWEFAKECKLGPPGADDGEMIRAVCQVVHF